MPPLTDERTRGNVVREWISGFPRDQIAEHTGIGVGTVSSIIANYKAGLYDLDFDSIRQLSVEARQHGLNLSELASHARLYNYFTKSGAAEDKIESFIAKVSSNDISSENVIELVYQLHEISKQESIPLDQVPEYIKQKLQEKQTLDEHIKEADATLQSKNVSIEAINEHVRLKEELKKYRLSTNDIHRLVNLLETAKEYRYSPGKIIAKLRYIKRLENKENKLKYNCEMLSKQADKYREIIPLAQLIRDLHIGKNELISFKVAVNEAAQIYGLTPSAAALRVTNVVSDYSKKGQLEHELSELIFQKYAINQFCSRHSQVIIALANLQTHGITEEQIISVNKSLESNGYKTSSYTSTKHMLPPNCSFAGKPI